MHGSGSMKRVYATLAFILVALGALAGGAGTGGAAATSLSVELVGQIDSVSSGGTIGYEATVRNVGPSTVTQVSFVVETGVATYRGNSAVTGTAPATCAQKTATSMLCTAEQIPSDKFFTVLVAFKAPAVTSDSSVTATATATVSAQTEGAPGNKGTSTWFATPATTPVTAFSPLSARSYALPGDSLSVGESLHTDVQLPAAYSNGHFGLVTSASEFTDAASRLCDKCPTVFSRLSIPASLTAQNPFTTSSPYTFTLTLAKDAQPPGFKPDGISHLADTPGAVWTSVPLCTSTTEVVPGPICLDAAPSQDKKTGVVTATGRGIENGNMGFD
jgi:hypothetical protein